MEVDLDDISGGEFEIVFFKVTSWYALKYILLPAETVINENKNIVFIRSMFQFLYS
jgi:hypothetical protein